MENIIFHGSDRVNNFLNKKGSLFDIQSSISLKNLQIPLKNRFKSMKQYKLYLSKI